MTRSPTIRDRAYSNAADYLRAPMPLFACHFALLRIDATARFAYLPGATFAAPVDMPAAMRLSSVIGQAITSATRHVIAEHRTASCADNEQPALLAAHATGLMNVMFSKGCRTHLFRYRHTLSVFFFFPLLSRLMAAAFAVCGGGGASIGRHSEHD